MTEPFTRRVLFLILAEFFLPLVFCAQGTGTIAGKITVTSEDRIFQEILTARAMHRYDDHPREVNEPRPYALSEKAVVYIETAGGRGKTEGTELRARLDQQDLMFRPLVLPILLGTSVIFPNNDDVFHNVFSYSKPGEFDLGRYPKGESRTVTFGNPGIVHVYCDIHAYMYATILVLDNPFFAVPNDEGNYSIEGVPSGTYQLNFWYGKKKVESRPITVKGGETVSADFVF